MSDGCYWDNDSCRELKCEDINDNTYRTYYIEYQSPACQSTASVCPKMEKNLIEDCNINCKWDTVTSKCVDKTEEEKDTDTIGSAATATMGEIGLESAIGSMNGSSTAMTGSSTDIMTASNMVAPTPAQSSKELVELASKNLWNDMLKILDHNSDGVITKDELKSMILDLPNSKHLIQNQKDILSKRARAGFWQMDLNKDDKVKKEEIEKFIKYYIMPRKMHKYKYLLKNLNPKQPGHLTFDEFFKITKRYGKDEATTKKLFDLFKGADKTVDGTELGHYLTVQDVANGFSYLKFFKKKEEELIKPQPKVEDKVDELKKASDELWETLLAKFGRNNEIRKITKSEIKSVKVKSNYKARLLKQLQRFFNAANKNKDNTITKTELMNMINNQLLPKVSEDFAKRAAKTFGGKVNKRMNRKEFEQFWPNTGSITSKVFAEFKGEDGLVDVTSVAKYYMTNFAKQYKKIALHAA